MKYWSVLILIVALYITNLYVHSPQLFQYRFDTNLINRYLCSQDITHEVPCPRLFLSDSDIYSASGYLYATGSDPTEYDFQQPPLLKYLFGFSSVIFGNPFLVQIFFGSAFLVMLFLLGLKIYKSSHVAFIACLLLVFDPVLIDVSSQTLLDLGQAFFLLLYVYLFFYGKNNYLLQGIVLGFFAASKFWAGPLFFVLLFTMYQMIKRQFVIKKFLIHLVVAFIIFSLTYAKTFINSGFAFNIIFFQAKIMKFMLDHDAHSIPFASVLVFLTGFVKTWWGWQDLIRTETWTLLWPISFIISILEVKNIILKKIIHEKTFVASIPLIYLLYLGVQAPFPRYFILILPFSYLALANYLVNKLKKQTFSKFY